MSNVPENSISKKANKLRTALRSSLTTRNQCTVAQGVCAQQRNIARSNTWKQLQTQHVPTSARHALHSCTSWLHMARHRVNLDEVNQHIRPTTMQAAEYGEATRSKQSKRMGTVQQRVVCSCWLADILLYTVMSSCVVVLRNTTIESIISEK